MALCSGTTSNTKVVSSSGVMKGLFCEGQITVSALMEDGISQLLFVKVKLTQFKKVLIQRKSGNQISGPCEVL